MGGLNRRAMISRTVDEGRRGGARRNYKEARIGKQSDGGMARPPLRLMRFLCLSFPRPRGVICGSIEQVREK